MGERRFFFLFFKSIYYVSEINLDTLRGCHRDIDAPYENYSTFFWLLYEN